MKLLDHIARSTLIVIISTLFICKPLQADVNPDPEAQKAVLALESFAQVMELLQIHSLETNTQTDLLKMATQGMVVKADRFGNYWDQAAYLEKMTPGRMETSGIGLALEEDAGDYKISHVFRETPADEAGLRAGMQIVAINGEDIRHLRMPQMLAVLRGKPGSVVRLTIRDNTGQLLTEYDIARVAVTGENIVSKLIEGSIIYLHITAFIEGSSYAIRKEISERIQEAIPKRPRGMILDLRDNTGGIISEAVDVVDAFIDSGQIISIEYQDSKRNRTHKAGKFTPFPELPLVVLVNRNTASAAEAVVVGLLENKRALIIGTVTRGKGTIQTLFELANGGAVQLTTARFYSPTGHAIDGVGITPSHELTPLYLDDVSYAYNINGIELDPQVQVGVAHLLQ